MSFNELLTVFSEQNISIWAEGDSILCRAPKGVLTEELKESIKEYRDELILFINNKKLEYEDINGTTNDVIEIEYSSFLSQGSEKNIDQIDSNTSHVERTDNEISNKTILPPSTVIEEVLSDIWTDVLKQDGIGIKDNFFDLGGDSLLATQVLTSVSDIFKVELSLLLHGLFSDPTINGLVDTLLANETTPGKTESIARIHQTINKMSPEEITAMLQEKKPFKSHP